MFEVFLQEDYDMKNIGTISEIALKWFLSGAEGGVKLSLHAFRQHKIEHGIGEKTIKFWRTCC